MSPPSGARETRRLRMCPRTASRAQREVRETQCDHGSGRVTQALDGHGAARRSVSRLAAGSGHLDEVDGRGRRPEIEPQIGCRLAAEARRMAGRRLSDLHASAQEQQRVALTCGEVLALDPSIGLVSRDDGARGRVGRGEPDGCRTSGGGGGSLSKRICRDLGGLRWRSLRGRRGAGASVSGCPASLRSGGMRRSKPAAVLTAWRSVSTVNRSSNRGR